jgi:hypothetical protein
MSRPVSNLAPISPRAGSCFSRSASDVLRNREQVVPVDKTGCRVLLILAVTARPKQHLAVDVGLSDPQAVSALRSGHTHREGHDKDAPSDTVDCC